MTTAELLWKQRVHDHLVGRRITAIRYMSGSEADECGWMRRPVVLQFDDGHYLFPMQDDEGNDGGALATSYDDLPTVPVMPGR